MPWLQFTLLFKYYQAFPFIMLKGKYMYAKQAPWLSNDQNASIIGYNKLHKKP